MSHVRRPSPQQFNRLHTNRAAQARQPAALDAILLLAHVQLCLGGEAIQDQTRKGPQGQVTVLRDQDAEEQHAQT